MMDKELFLEEIKSAKEYFVKNAYSDDIKKLRNQDFYFGAIKVMDILRKHVREGRFDVKHEGEFKDEIL